jgi:hypothetical protein
MKTIKYVFLLFLFIISIRINGDVIIAENSPSTICARIINLDEYPEISLIGFYDCLAISGSNKAIVFRSITCLNINRFCPLTLCAVKKKYLNKKHLEDIDWKKDTNVIKSNLTINTRTYNISKSVLNILIEYKIAEFSNSSLFLYKTKQTLKYKDQRPDSVEYFTIKGDLSKPNSDFK